MDKEFAGQPLWLWAVGAAVVIGGYLWISRKSSSSAPAAPAAGGGGGTGKSTTTIHETITDLQSHPKKVR